MEYIAIWVIVGAVTIINVMCTFFVLSKNRFPSTKKGMTQHYHLDVDSSDLLPPEEMTTIRQQANEKMQQAFEDSFVHFDRSLESMITKLSDSANKQIEERVTKELGKYEAQIEQTSKILQDTTANLAKAIQQDAVQAHTALQAEVAKEKEQRIASFDQRMEDVVSSYITQSINSTANMDAQTELIISWLDEHKDAIRKDLA